MAARKSKVEPLEPRIEERLIRIFQKPVLDTAKVTHEVEALAGKHGDAVYTSLLYLLAHLEFPAHGAQSQWGKIIAHHAQLKKKLGRPVDLRVALLDHFVSRNRKLKNPKILELKIYQLAQREALSDELTGLFNYRYFEKALDQELQRAYRYNRPLSLLFFDIDDFKHYNDRNGHLAGNQVLRRAAKILNHNVRKIDIVTRYGGEEFAILLPSTTKQGALLTAERIRDAVAKHKFPFGSNQPKKKVTVSGGIATYPIDAEKGAQLIERADTALYRAKSDGKNAVRVFMTETRSFTRVNSKLVGSFTVLAHRNVKLSTRDLSKSGILFESNRTVPIGSLLDLAITIPKSKPVKLRAEVIRVERVSSRRFDIGVAIMQMSAADRRRFDAHIEELLSTS